MGGIGQDFPDAGTDFFFRHPEKGPELSREGMVRGIFQRGAGADGKQGGIGEMACQVSEDFLLRKCFVDAEKGRHRKTGFRQQKQVFGFCA